VDLGEIMQLWLGLVCGILVSTVAWRARALNRSGAWAAAVCGGLVFGLGGLPWAILLLAFFVSSSGLSRLAARRKAAVNEKFSKGSQRDWGQVAANGGLGALLAIVHALWPASLWPWMAFAGAMAAVNADTWATELGVLSSQPPRLIIRGTVVERGTSGGISWYGTIAALFGAALIALLAALFTPAQPVYATLGLVCLAGWFASLFDSLLGATVQAIYRCPVCQKETERHPLHTCGTVTVQVRGWGWLNNDWVNFACSLVGAILAFGFWR
jgi:uncharacterized protein (TIGR00297 family)